MHNLEHILLVTSWAVDHDEISKAELVRTLEALAGASHGFVPETAEADAGLSKLNDEWGRRFGRLGVETRGNHPAGRCDQPG